MNAYLVCIGLALLAWACERKEADDRRSPAAPGSSVTDQQRRVAVSAGIVGLQGISDTAWVPAYADAHPSADGWWVDSLLFANLDQDTALEVFALLVTVRDTVLHGRPDRLDEHRAIVLDSTSSGLRPALDVEVFGSTPEGPKLIVFNPSIRTPAFGVHHWHGRGSGAYHSAWKVFRMDEGVAHESDEITDESALGMCAEVVNQEVDGGIAQPSSDHLAVTYRYAFFPNWCLQDTMRPSCGDPAQLPLPAISRSVSIAYEWDSSSHRFEPQYEGTGLTPDKIACLSDIGVSEIFLRAFADDLRAAASSKDRCRARLALILLRELQPTE